MQIPVEWHRRRPHIETHTCIPPLPSSPCRLLLLPPFPFQPNCARAMEGGRGRDQWEEGLYLFQL